MTDDFIAETSKTSRLNRPQNEPQQDHTHEEPQFTARCVQSIHQVPSAIWRYHSRQTNPFISYEFLSALEDSQSLSPAKGWQAFHIIIDGPAGPAFIPQYIKGHSMGEYIFDHNWAEAYSRAGGDYYPKLQIASPFSPVTSQRILLPKDPNKPELSEAIKRQYYAAFLDATAKLCDQYGFSSSHITFCQQEEHQALTSLGMLGRVNQQYHWENHWNNKAYADFDDFLNALLSRKRKSIKKERRQARDAVNSIKTLTGTQMTPDLWDAFYRFYQDTGARKWGRPYLNRDFFSLLAKTMGDQIIIFMAFDHENTPTAAALNIVDDTKIYGRYWGCNEYIPALHFELCYYQAIDYAIQHGLKTVEAGAQGDHKVARGYLSTPVYSLHYMHDPQFKQAVSNYLDHETQEIRAMIDAINANHSPYKIS